MTFPFQPAADAILVDVEITGPLRTLQLSLILDTGATATLLSTSALARAGVDPTDPLTARPIQVMTASGPVPAARVLLTRLSSLGRHRFGFSVVAHDLPASAQADGVLGLDFFRGTVLTLDFVAGQISLR